MIQITFIWEGNGRLEDNYNSEEHC